MIKRKTELARQVRSIREDYSGVSPEDMPEDITNEIAEYLREMTELRKVLGN